MDRVAVLEDLDDGAARLAGVLDLEHDLMEVWVERLAQRFHLLDAATIERGEELAFRRFDADQKIFQRFVLLALLCRNCLDRAAQVVGDRHQILGEAADGVLRGVLPLALGAAADVLGLGQGTQKLVLEAGYFGFQRRDLLSGGTFGALLSRRFSGGGRLIGGIGGMRGPFRPERRLELAPYRFSASMGFL